MQRNSGYRHNSRLSCTTSTIQIYNMSRKQSIITLRYEGQLFWKISRTLNVSPSAVTKTIKWWCYDETGCHEDRPRKERPRATSAEKDVFIRNTSLRKRWCTAPEIKANIKAFQRSRGRHISTSTVQRRLHDSDVHSQIVAKKPILPKTKRRELLEPKNTTNEC